MENKWRGFYKKTINERLNILKDFLDNEHFDLLKNEVLSVETANNMVENVVGTFSLPFSIVPNFVVDEKEYTLPMVTEEPSVVAACSNAGKLVAKCGGFKTTIHDRKMIGHVALYNIADTAKAMKTILDNKEFLLNIANDAHPSIVLRGGGAKDIEVKTLTEDNTTFVVVYLIADTLEAMGANMINTMLEALKPVLENLTAGVALMAILSNYATSSLITTKCELSYAIVGAGDEQLGYELAKKIELASKFAKMDIYRAATHNKGIFNGIDSIVIATGNDWRAIEAACHSYAVKNNRYEGLSTWKIENNKLVGELTLPMPIASVGGSIGINPSVKVARNLLKSPDAKTLGTIIVSVGLAQNLAALKALVSDGIQKGHMKLHAKSLVILANCPSDKVDIAVENLLKEKHLNLANAKKVVLALE